MTNHDNWHGSRWFGGDDGARAIGAIDDVGGRRRELRGHRQRIGKSAALTVGVPDLVWIAERGGHQPLVPWLEYDDPLALRQHDTTERNHALAAHGLAITANASCPTRSSGVM